MLTSGSIGSPINLAPGELRRSPPYWEIGLAMAYKVLVDDNYHYMDESKRYELGEFHSYEEAVAASKRIVDEYLLTSHRPGMTAQQL